MTDKHLSRHPHACYSASRPSRGKASEDAWFYEEPAGINVVCKTPGQYVIRWASIEAALKRKRRKRDD